MPHIPSSDEVRDPILRARRFAFARTVLHAANQLAIGDKSDDEAVALVRDAWRSRVGLFLDRELITASMAHRMHNCTTWRPSCWQPSGLFCRSWMCPWCRARSAFKSLRVFEYPLGHDRGSYAKGHSLLFYAYERVLCDDEHRQESYVRELQIAGDLLRRLGRQGAVVAGEASLELMPHYTAVAEQGRAFRLMGFAALIVKDVWCPSPIMDWPFLRAELHAIDDRSIERCVGHTHSYGPGILAVHDETSAYLAAFCMRGFRSRRSFGDFYGKHSNKREKHEGN